MSREKKLLFDAGLLFIVGIFASILGYVIRMVLSRQLSLYDFGLFYAVFAFVGFFVVFRDLGLSVSLMKFIPEFLVRKENDKVKSSIKFVVFFNLVISLVFVLIFILLSSYLAENYFKNSLAKPLLIILSIYFIFYSIYRVLMNIFVGFQRSEFYSLDLFFINLFVLGGIFIFSKLGVFSPAISYLAAAFFGVIFGGIVFLKLFNYFKYKEDYSGKLRFRLFSYGLPLLLAALGYIVIGQIDVLMLTGFRSLSEVGIYSVVLPTAMLLITLGSSMAEAILPYISEHWASKNYTQLKKVINEIYQKAFVIIVPAGLVLFIFSDLILGTLFGSEFISGSVALKILSLGAIFFSVATINGNIISALGKPRMVTGIVLLATLLNVLVNLILIPVYGITGAAIATTLSYLLILILSSYYIRKFISVKIPLFKWLKTFIAGFLFIYVVSFLGNVLEFNLWLEAFTSLVLGLVVYLVLISVLKVMKLREIVSSFRGLIKR
jgi:O-antigen/teichoic acid export membrane protein